MAKEEERQGTRYGVCGIYHQWTNLPPLLGKVFLSSGKKYLYEKIREYCREDVQDLMPTYQPPNTTSAS